MKKIFITGIAWLVVVHGYAQNGWSYRDCIRYALENNLRLNSAAFNEERQRLNYKGAINSFFPSVSASSSYEIREGRSLDPETNGYTDNKNFQNIYGVGANLLLFNGFRQQNQLAYEKYRLQAAQEEHERQKNDIAFLVIDAYTTHLSNLGLVEIQEEQVELSRQEVHRISRRIDLGLASGSDMYEAQARLASDEYLFVQYKNLTNQSESNLKRLMNLPLDTTVILAKIPAEREAFVSFSPDSLIDVAGNRLPAVKSMQAQLLAAQKLVSAIRSSLLPTLDAYGSWGTSYFGAYETEIRTFDDQFKNNRQLRYGLSLNIPLFDAFRRRNNLQIAKINREEAENNLKMALQDMEYEIYQALLDWQGAVAEHQSAEKTAESMELAFEVAEKKREKGLISIMDFYEAKNNLSTAKADVLRTELQLFMRERIINFYLTGSLID